MVPSLRSRGGGIIVGSAAAAACDGLNFHSHLVVFRGVSSSLSTRVRTSPASRRTAAIRSAPWGADGRGAVGPSRASAARKELRAAGVGLVSGVQLLLEVVVLLGVVGVVRRRDAHDGGVLAEATAIWTRSGRPAAGVHPAWRKRHRRVVVTRYYAHWRGVGPTHRGIHRRT